MCDSLLYPLSPFPIFARYDTWLLSIVFPQARLHIDYDNSIFGGIPEHFRPDNGLEFTAKATRTWLNRLGAKTLYIELGSSWENGYIEPFSGNPRDKLFNREIFTTLDEAKVLIEQWRREYNQVCPHSARNNRPPEPEAILVMTTM